MVMLENMGKLEVGVVLENKLGITSSAELADAEERLSKKRAAELFDDGLLESLEAGSFAALKAIHLHLFGDIYDFAGEMRGVDIAKGGFRFALVLYLADAVARIEAMPQSAFDEIVEKYVEMNVAHPFLQLTRFGCAAVLNGRAGTSM